MKTKKNLTAPITALVAGALITATVALNNYSANLNKIPDPEHNIIQTDSLHNERLANIINPIAIPAKDSAPLLLPRDIANKLKEQEQEKTRSYTRDEDGFKVYFSRKDSTYYKSLTNRILSELHPDVFTEVVSVDFILGNYATESRFNPNAKSRKADNSVLAAGTGQFTQDTWNSRGYNKLYGNFKDNILNPEKNIPASVDYKLYIEQLLLDGADRYKEGIDKLWNARSIEEKQALILIAYNQGPHETKKDLKKAHYDFKELQKYISSQSKNHVTRVFAYMNYLEHEENKAKMANLLIYKPKTDSATFSGQTLEQNIKY